MSVKFLELEERGYPGDEVQTPSPLDSFVLNFTSFTPLNGKYNREIRDEETELLEKRFNLLKQVNI